MSKIDLSRMNLDDREDFLREVSYLTGLSMEVAETALPLPWTHVLGVYPREIDAAGDTPEAWAAQWYEEHRADVDSYTRGATVAMAEALKDDARAASPVLIEQLAYVNAAPVDRDDDTPAFIRAAEMAADDIRAELMTRDAVRLFLLSTRTGEITSMTIGEFRRRFGVDYDRMVNREECICGQLEFYGYVEAVEARADLVRQGIIAED